MFTLRLLTSAAVLCLAATVAGAQDTDPTWSLEPELRIGSLDDGPYALSSVSHVVVSPRTGAVFIAQFGRIGVFDAAGRHLRTFGRRGEGPGEFSRVAALAWSSDRLVALKGSPGRAMHRGTPTASSALASKS
jgi:hypothetical protein